MKEKIQNYNRKSEGINKRFTKFQKSMFHVKHLWYTISMLKGKVI